MKFNTINNSVYIRRNGFKKKALKILQNDADAMVINIYGTAVVIAKNRRNAFD